MATLILSLYFFALAWAAAALSVDAVLCAARWVRKEFFWRGLRSVDLAPCRPVLPEQRNRLRILGQVRMAGMPGALVL